MEWFVRIARNQDGKLSCREVPGARFAEPAGDGDLLLTLAG